MVAEGLEDEDSSFSDDLFFSILLCQCSAKQEEEDPAFAVRDALTMGFSCREDL